MANAMECYPLKIISEGSVSAGIRRIEAKAGSSAVEYMMERDRILDQVQAKLKVSNKQVHDVLTQIDKLKQKRKGGATSAKCP